MHWFIPAISFILSSLSLITLRSIAPELVSKQLLFFGVGFVGFYAAAIIKFQIWQKLSSIGYWLLNLLLIGLLVLGVRTRGVTGWINFFGDYQFQPSQFALLITSLFLTLKAKNFNWSNWRGLIKWLLIIIFPTLLILAQPDFGISIILLISLGASLLIVPVKLKQLLLLGLVGLITMLLSWSVMLKPYQKQRLTSFIAPDQQEEDAGYNARQALIAVGSGQIFGRGLGFGVQSHLRFLPARQTDFVFASLAEEWGFIGAMIVIVLYMVLTILLVTQAIKLKEPAYKIYLLCLGIMTFVQVVINIGMNLGLMPITGITLPLISYGGSSIVSYLFSLGIAFQIMQKNKKQASLYIS
jgi:rod shape determining protein RodA